MAPLSQLVLRTDASGMPLEWIGFQEAVRLYHLDQVVYSLGTYLYTVHGGINARSGRRSLIEVNSIVATRHQHKAKMPHDYCPPLNNRTLFKRDDYLCLYCGVSFRPKDLSRDHITPVSLGGEDVWNNVATACKRCNSFKAGRTPEQAGLQLIAIPFVPTHAEYIYLQGRQILSDQMSFLRAHFPRKSPLYQRLQGFMERV
jgi:5-methylcytosine-specific restriction endonuclease McrA